MEPHWSHSEAARSQFPVIPVLVQDAEMPHADELPESIRALIRRNGISQPVGVPMSIRAFQLIQDIPR